MTLTAAQYNVLNKIARRTKMDCWFLLRQDKKGNDYVFDIEECASIELRDGVIGLLEGLDCLETMIHCHLNNAEKTALCELCYALDIQVPIALEVIN